MNISRFSKLVAIFACVACIAPIASASANPENNYGLTVYGGAYNVCRHTVTVSAMGKEMYVKAWIYDGRWHSSTWVHLGYSSLNWSAPSETWTLSSVYASSSVVKAGIEYWKTGWSRALYEEVWGLAFPYIC
jgi:hypothetical protein